jgi:hypothetical protein
LQNLSAFPEPDTTRRSTGAFLFGLPDDVVINQETLFQQWSKPNDKHASSKVTLLANSTVGRLSKPTVS